MVTLATIVLALADCLDALERDPERLEAYVRRYPEYQAELGSLLQLAAALRRLPEGATPRDAFLDDLKSRLLKEFPARNDGRGGEGV